MTYPNHAWLFLKFGFITLLASVPFLVHAGVLSLFFDTAVAETVTPITYSESSNPQTVALLKAATHIDPNPAKGGGDILVEDGVLVPHGDIDGKNEIKNTKTANGEISVYVVREGDTLSQIAQMFDVSGKTILWANDITDPTKIRPGDSLVILPITGVRHVVKQGDSIQTIAKKYNGDVDDILAYNQLSSATDVKVGDTVVIPDGTISAPAPTKTTQAKPTKTTGGGKTTVATGGGSAGFVHPVPSAIKTQGIHGYNGIDLGAPAGTPIQASAGGEVIVAKTTGWNGGYGIYAVIKHANGVQTLYAHMSRIAVAPGDTVVQGQVIGYVGRTGNSTGNHLHYEVRGARNPF